MRLLPLASLLLVAVPVHAQDVADGGSQPPAARPAPAAAFHVSSDVSPEDARVAAQLFFRALLSGEPRAVVEASAFPFTLEDRKIANNDEAFRTWLQVLRQRRTDQLELRGIEILTPAEMEKKYGKPPARLANFPWRAPRSVIAVASLSGQPAVAVLLPLAVEGWRVIAYHD